MGFIQSASKGYGRMLVDDMKLIVCGMTCNTLIIKVDVGLIQRFMPVSVMD
jgi:hypothetical protein